MSDWSRVPACLNLATISFASIAMRQRSQGLRAGVLPIFEPGLEELVLRNAAAGRLTFASDLAELNNGVEAVFIAVGTPPSSIDQSADLSSVFAVARDVALASSTGLVIVTKSTVPVGTGDEIAGIMRSAAPTLRFHVASNPEFLREGSAIGDFMAPDRIVIGLEDDRARDVLERVYAPLTARGAPLLSTSRRAAELVKYASNCFLATKISFINEVADLCEAVGADVEEVAAGMGLDRRIGSAFLRAGPGYGGSCFPKDCDAMLATAGTQWSEAQCHLQCGSDQCHPQERHGAACRSRPGEPRQGQRGGRAWPHVQGRHRRRARNAGPRPHRWPEAGGHFGASVRSPGHGARAASSHRGGILRFGPGRLFGSRLRRDRHGMAGVPRPRCQDLCKSDAGPHDRRSA